MKKAICSLVLTGLMSAGVAVAQNASTGSTQDQAATGQADRGAEGHGRHHADPDERLAHMTKRYSLTADQQSQIKPILADGQQQMESLRSDTSLSRQDKFAKFQSLRQEQSQKISAVLTDEQRKKFDADQQRQQQRWAEHAHGGADASAAPATQPQQ